MLTGKRVSTQSTLLSFARTTGAPCFHSEAEVEQELGLPVSGLPGWQSFGQGKTSTVDIPLHGVVPVTRLSILGIFSDPRGEAAPAAGTLAASFSLHQGAQLLYHHELLTGLHVRPATEEVQHCRILGDGTQLIRAGILTAKEPLYVHWLMIDLPNPVEADRLRFRDLGLTGTFTLFDVVVDRQAAVGCPFHSAGGGIALSEIGAIVRVGDRVRFLKALQQMEASLPAAEDLDEARGLALTFLAMVTAAMLETGGSRELHRAQLEASRQLDKAQTLEEIRHVAKAHAESIAAPIFRDTPGPSSYLVDRALSLVERNFARELTDASVAQQLGLSTSHFRFLFKHTTGQPFHKYLVALRLEKARKLLVEQDLPVSEVARAVGFVGLSHFSRAFAQRFQESPTSLRRRVD